MRKVAYVLWLPFLCMTALSFSSCQSATSTDTTLKVDDFVDSSVAPSPTNAVESTDGRTYRVVRGNNQPDDIFPYLFKTSYAVTLTINKNATDKDVDLTFPVEITSTTVKVEQASGGIVTTTTGTDTAHYDSVLVSATGNTISAVNGSVTLKFDVWYSLPSAGKECLITTSISFKDDDDVTFTKNVKVNVNP
jgi:hypothetical protein